MRMTTYWLLSRNHLVPWWNLDDLNVSGKIFSTCQGLEDCDIYAQQANALILSTLCTVGGNVTMQI